MIDQQLQQLGLHKNEIAVYLTLFELGKCRAAKIITTAKLHRNLVYTSLESLVAKKLVSKTEIGRVAAFEANDPNSLVELIDNQKSLATEVAEALTKKQQTTPRDIKVYEGLDGILQARDRVLTMPAGESVYVMGGSPSSSTPEFERMWLKYHRARIKNKINHKVMFDVTTPREYVQTRQNMSYTQAKYLPFNVAMPAWFEVFGDIIGIGVPGDDPILFSLKNAAAADGLKKFFEYLWKQEVTVETGWTALRQAFITMINELNPGEEYWVLGAATGKINDLAMQKIFDDVHRYRIEKGVVVKMSAYKEYYRRAKQRFADCGDPQGKISFVRVQSGDQPVVPLQINVYRTKTIMIIHGSEPTILHFDRPEINAAFRAYFQSVWNQDSYILRGPEALRDLWLEAIEAGELRWIGARGYFMDTYPELTKPILEKAKAGKGVVWKNIVDAGFKGHLLTTLPWSQTKYTKTRVKNPNVTWLFGNKMVISNWTENEPTMFVSENPYLVQSQNDYFENLWNSL